MVFLVLVLTIVVALVTWLAQAAAIRTHLRSRFVLALGAACTSALLTTTHAPAPRRPATWWT